jgi:hypothetical protein
MHRKVRMPDNMYQHWEQWQKEAEVREAEEKEAQEKERKYPDGGDNEELNSGEEFGSYERTDYMKYVMRGLPP